MARPSKPAPSAAAKKEARAASADNMRTQCGLDPASPKPLTAGQRSYLKAQAGTGTPAERAAARAKLEERR